MISIRASLMVLVTAAIPVTGLALSEDRDQPISVESDHAELDRNTNVGTYTGTVVVIQGTFRLNADRMVITAPDGRLARIVASGEPAAFRQRPDGSDTDMIGEARQIDYLADRSLVVLTGDAWVRQGEDIVRSERIEYDLGRDVVRARMVEGSDARVRMTLYPRKKNSDDAQ